MAALTPPPPTGTVRSTDRYCQLNICHADNETFITQTTRRQAPALAHRGRSGSFGARPSDPDLPTRKETLEKTLAAEPGGFGSSSTQDPVRWPLAGRGRCTTATMIRRTAPQDALEW